MFKSRRLNLFNDTSLDLKRAGITIRELETMLDEVFEFGNNATRNFMINLYWDTVIDKIREPMETFKHHWMVPGGTIHFGLHHYSAQYVWDTAFMLDMLAYLPHFRKITRDVFQTWWDVQDARDEIVPDYARGMIPHGYSPKSIKDSYPSKTCNPIIAWAVERIYERHQDEELAKEALPHLERYHDWYWRERDLDGIGLISFGSYDDSAQKARDEQGYDFACDTDTLIKIPHPKRPDGPAHYGNLYGVATTAYVIQAEGCLARLAKKLGDNKMAERRLKYQEKAINAMREHMWDQESGMFLTIRRGGEKIQQLCVANWMPLFTEVPNSEQAERIISRLATPEWMTPLPVPTVGRTDPLWEPGRLAFLPEPPKRLDHAGNTYNMWRGDVWPPANYQIASGLKRWQEQIPLAGKLMNRICDASIMNAMIQNDINERYDCDTGEGLGVSNLGMSCCLGAMALDGLTNRYTVHFN
jgi:putative isomerase